MSGKGVLKRSQQLAIRCANLRDEGLSLSEISKLTGLDRDKVNVRIELGRRLRDLFYE